MNFFLSPGFGGLCAVIGAAIAYGAATVATRQKVRTDTDQRRQAEVDRAWSRFVWLVSHRQEFNLPLIASLMTQLTSTADRLGDQDLVAFAQRLGTELLREGNELLQGQDRPGPAGPSTSPPPNADTGSDHEGT